MTLQQVVGLATRWQLIAIQFWSVLRGKLTTELRRAVPFTFSESLSHPNNSTRAESTNSIGGRCSGNVTNLPLCISIEIWQMGTVFLECKVGAR